MIRSLLPLLVFASAASAADFDRDIAPLLADKCLDCHSGAKPKAKLDLSRKDAALAQLVAGKPHQSTLWEKVANNEMPPKKPLTDAEKKLLFQWIADGAKWGTDPIDPFRVTTAKRAGLDWWSLRPVQRPELPAVKDGAWVRNPIDRFILAALEAKKLKPSPEADRRTLIRRLHFDLIGLPPSPEEVAAFVADKSPDAYEKLVDRLLASPHYGERWARHWLDVVRFGESDGFERNGLRANAWPYRDWVIRALNADLPFDEFVRLQLAGDVLRPGDIEALKATGYLVAGVHNTVVPIMDAAKASAFQDELEDLVGNVGQTFLGLTANCARCHDHKFDPIAQKDYYRFAATLAGVRHGERDLPQPQVMVDLLSLSRQIWELAKQLRAIEGPTRPLVMWDFRKGADSLKLDGAKWTTDGLVFDGKSFARSTPLQHELREKTLDAWVKLSNLGQSGGGVITVETLDGAVFDSIVFGEKEPWRWMAGSNNYQRTESFHEHAEADAAKRTVRFTIVYSADGTITGYRDGKPYGKPYKSKGPVKFEAGKAVVTFGLRHSPPGGDRFLSGTIVQARLYDRALSWDEIAANEEITSEPKLTAEERQRAETLRKQIAMLTAELGKLEAKLTAKLYVAGSAPPGPSRVLIRGQASDPGEAVTPGGLAAVGRAELGLTEKTTEGERRKKLAEWVTHRDNPLFARVIVNRLWHYHFGTGIVETPNDFGFNGGRPSHPELLDWLVNELASGGRQPPVESQPINQGANAPRSPWTLKRLHKLIVTSATYRQSSAPRSDALAIDADSRLLWCKRPLRLEGESLRDSMLAVAGLLNREIGGKGFTDYAIGDGKAGTTFYDPIDPVGPEFHRRSVYRFAPRAANPGLLDAFDCPDPAAAAPRRNSTTTPLQALSLLNSSFTLRMAEAFAARVGNGTPEEQVKRMYRLAFQREPLPAEADAAAKLVREHGLKALARALFNTNEFLSAE